MSTTGIPSFHIFEFYKMINRPQATPSPTLSLRERIHRVLNDPDLPIGRVIAWTIQALIVTSIITYSLETLPDLSPAIRRWLTIIESVTVVIFTAEYLARLWAEPRTRDYAFSFFGLVDLAAILPFWLSTGFDFRYARILRMLRLFRILKLTRYNRAMQRFHRALMIAREEIVVYLSITAMLLFVAAAGIYHFEHEAQPEQFSSIFSSMWWSLATLTTVGYGDVYPITLGGRCFTAIMLMLGLGVVAVPAGLVASSLSTAREMEQTEAQAAKLEQWSSDKSDANEKGGSL
ncbi:MAG: ion transporter [Pirellulaceae bacterium]